MTSRGTTGSELAPPEPSLAWLYATFGGAKVYFDELPGGNNGDELIIRGSRRFHREFGFDSVDRPDDADVIIVRGNGVLTDFYSHTPHRGRIQSYIDQFPATTFILEPSTLSFATEPALLLSGHDAPVYLYARDRTSFESERNKPANGAHPAFIGLDHDMAFRLAGSALLGELLAGRTPRHNLIVERFDIERPDRRLRRRPGRAAVSRLVPPSLKGRLRPHLARTRAILNRGFQDEARRLLAASAFPDLPEVSGDLSNPLLYSFDEFLGIIRDSGVVVTQRLHVGILSALLGIETWLDDRGYYKIRGIWEQSMESMAHVHLLSEASTRETP